MPPRRFRLNQLRLNQLRLNQLPWVLLPLLGLGAIAAVAVGSRPNPEASSSSPPAPSPAPFTTANLLPTPAASPRPAPSPKPSSSPKAPAAKPSIPPVAVGPDGKPALTPEQQAMNDRAKAAFKATKASVDSVIQMRVALVSGVASLTLGTSSGATLVDQQGRSLAQLAANTPYTVSVAGAGMAVGNQSLPEVVWVQPPPNGLLQLGDRSYHGTLLLAVRDGRLWAVNYIDMRRYLYSVVGSEVSPSWPMAALKAQAIAARSYALVYYFRPVSSLFHLGSDEYYQVYGGIEREADVIRQAVDETAGEFVSYRGGVVESLYAASDDIVAEAFQGRGMSQLGAYDMAQQGYGDRQILSHYYPGTGVARIEFDHE